jgi:hypothetical protein
VVILHPALPVTMAPPPYHCQALHPHLPTLGRCPTCRAALVELPCKACSLAKRLERTPAARARPRDDEDHLAPWPAHVPAPDEIAAACRESQSRWTAEERRSRSVLPGPIRWLPPFCSIIPDDRELPP